MSALAKLTLVAGSKAAPRNDTELRRHKLINRLREQRQVAEAQLKGQVHTTRKRVVTADSNTGERQVSWVDRPVRAWYWLAQTGDIQFPVKYGSKPLELAKGKNAIAVKELAELPTAIDAVIQAVSDGELDNSIDALLARRRK